MTVHSPNYHPELPTSPPEMSDEEYERNCRNMDREESMELIDRLICNLNAIGHDGKVRGTQKYLIELRDYLKRDMED